MAPPELARDAPVLDVVQPLVVGVHPVFRMKLDLAGGDTRQSLFGDAFTFSTRLAHRDEPLVGQHRFDHHAGAVATRHLQFVLLGLVEQACRFEVSHDDFARLETIHAAIFFGRFIADPGIQGQDADHSQFVSLTHRIVIEVVRGRDLDHARAEFLVHIVVGDDGNFTLAQGEFNGLADQVAVAFIFRVHHHSHVAQQRLGAGGGDGKIGQAMQGVRHAEWIADVIHETVFFFLHHFQIGYGGMQFRIPVHQALAAIDQALVEKAHEGFSHRPGQALIHGETLARPVGGGAQPAHLTRDTVAGVLFPFPDFFDEFFPAQIMARNALCIQLAFDDDLGRDARVVGARLPQGVVAAHPVIAGQRVHQRLVETMTHVQRAGDIGRRQLNAERFRFCRIHACLEKA